MPHIHSRANPGFDLRSLNALTATIWGRAYWYKCLETMESHQGPHYMANDGRETAQLCVTLASLDPFCGLLYNPFLNERKETQR